MSGLVTTMFVTRVRFIGQDGERHLGRYVWERFGEGVCRSHAGLQRVEPIVSEETPSRFWPDVLFQVRPCAQSRRAGAVQRHGRALHRAGGSQPLGRARSEVGVGLNVIARRKATKKPILSLRVKIDCFAEAYYRASSFGEKNIES
jgi:hypothetical protein